MSKVTGSKGCFAAGTLVSTPTGNVDIDDLKVDAVVYSFDEDGNVIIDTVTEVHHHEPEQVFTYRFWGGHTVTATPSHWVLNQYGAFVAIGTLTTDDCIQDELGHLRPLLEVTTGDVIPVFNISVQKNKTFFANGIRVHNQGTGARHPRVKGSKGKSGGGAAAVEDPNTLRSRATVKVIDLISQGEVYGLVDKVNPLKSVFFDDTPLMNSDASLNFGNCFAEERVGTVGQAYIEGFPSANNPVTVNTTVTTTTPVTRTISADTDAATVTIGISTLFNTNKETGDIKGNSVHFLIQRKLTSGGVWTTIKDETITGKTMRPYERDYRIPRAGSVGVTWDIRVVRVTADDTLTSTQSGTSWNRYVERKDVKLAYPEWAYVAVAADAESTGGSIPKRSFDVKGMLVKVPNNYNPLTRAYTGTWTGTFSSTLQWTDNPAWILYDFILDPKYGLGEFINESMLDRYSFYAAAAYNDVLVPYTNQGVTVHEPRFTFNSPISTQEDAWKSIQAIASSCNSFIGEAGGYITLIQDRPKTAKKLVTRSNVIDGRFSYQGTSVLARHNAVNVTYNDPTDNYLPKTITETLPSAIAKYGYNPTDLLAFGVTNEAQARRCGKWLIETENSATEVLTYQASWDHIDTVPGDIIKVVDPHYSGYDAGGRVKLATTNTITLDRLIDHSGGGPYNIDLMDTDGQTIYTRTIATWSVAGGVSVVNVAALPVVVPVETIYTITGAVAPRQFRIVSQKEEKAGIFSITALFHDPNKYARIEGGVLIPTPTYSAVGKTPPKAPTSLTVNTESYFDNQTLHRRLRVNWVTSASDYIVRHSVKYSVDGKPFTNIDNISQPELLLNDVTPGQYTFVVTCYNVVNVGSPSVQVVYNLSTGANGTATTSSTLKAPVNIGVDIPLNSTRGSKFWTEDVNIGWDDPVDNINMTGGVTDVTSSYFVEFLRPDSSVMYSTTVNKPAHTFNWSMALNMQKFSASSVPTGSFSVRVTAIDAFGRKGLASSAVALSVVSMTPPQNLASTAGGTTWNTADLSVNWNCYTSGYPAISASQLNTLGFFKNFRVVVKSGVATLKTEYITANSYTFSLADNVKAAGGLPKGTLSFEITAFDDFGNITTTTVQTFTAVLPPAVSLLSLFNGSTVFTTKNIATKWECSLLNAPYSQSSLFSYYRVRVFGASSTIGYSAKAETFIYDFAANMADNGGIPYPTPTVTVSAIDIFGREGTATAQTFTAVLPPVCAALVQPNAAGTIFFTQDLSVVWECIPAVGVTYSSYDLFAGYELQVQPYGGGTSKRTFLTSTENYTYLFTDNVKDFGGVPSRDITLQVRAKDVFNQVGGAATTGFQNPSPAAPSFSFTTGYNIQHFTLNPPSDPDALGYIIWVSTSSGFTPDDTYKVYDGSDLFGSFPVLPNSTYYARAACYDVFSKTGLTLSTQLSFSTLQDVKASEYKFAGITFTPNAGANTVSWTSGQMLKVGDTSTITVGSGSSGTYTGAGAPQFIFSVWPSITLQTSYNLANIYTANPGSTVTILGVYRGGSDLTQGDGRVLMDGGYLLAQTVGTNQLVASSVTATQVGANLIITQAANINDAVITNAHIVTASIETLKLKNGAITNNTGVYTLSATYNQVAAFPAGQPANSYKDSGWQTVATHIITNPDATAGGPGALIGNVYVYYGMQMATGLTTSGGGGKEYYDGFTFSAGTHAYRVIVEALDMNDGLWYRQNDGAFWTDSIARAEATNYFVGDRPERFGGSVRFIARQSTTTGQAGPTTISQGNYYRPNQQFRLKLQARTSIYNGVSTAENFTSFPPNSFYVPFKYYTGLSGSTLVQLNSGVGTPVTYLPSSTQVRNAFIATQQLYK